MSQHINNLNREKQGRDKLFYVVTKISTQCKEVMSRQNKLGHDRMSKLNTKVFYLDMKIGSRQQKFDNTKKSCRNIRTKLQQEVELSGNKPPSRQAFWVAI